MFLCAFGEFCAFGVDRASRTTSGHDDRRRNRGDGRTRRSKNYFSASSRVLRAASRSRAAISNMEREAFSRAAAAAVPLA
jgi:hypothetical protein